MTTTAPTTHTDWPRRIREAYERIRGTVRETPLEPAHNLAGGYSVEILFKCEHLQHTGTFKFRGAANKIALLTPDQARAGVIAASNGNHGLGVAAAAAAHDIAAEIFVSEQVSPAKAEAIRRLGARVTLAGKEPLQAELTARRAAEASGKVFISPYNDADVICGQGTIGVELGRQIREISAKSKVDAVYVAVGGGGLIGGIGGYLKSVSPGTEIVGCWPETSPVLYESMKAGRIIDVAEKPTLSESTAGGLEPGSITLDLARSVVDRAVLVSETEILAAMRQVLDQEHWLIEGSAAVAVAACMKDADRLRGKTAVVIICGRNVSERVVEQLLNAG